MLSQQQQPSPFALVADDDIKLESRPPAGTLGPIEKPRPADRLSQDVEHVLVGPRRADEASWYRPSRPSFPNPRHSSTYFSLGGGHHGRGEAFRFSEFGNQAYHREEGRGFGNEAFTLPSPPLKATCSEDGPPGTRLVVLNLSFDVTGEELCSFFGRLGFLKDAYMPLDARSQRNRGFAFLEYESVAVAKVARFETDQHVLKGRAMRVRYAREDDRHTTSLKVRNLSLDVTTQDLWKCFQRVGGLQSIHRPRDVITDQPYAFAFVVYTTVEQAVKARWELDQVIMKGSALQVRFAKPRRTTDAEMGLQHRFSQLSVTAPRYGNGYRRESGEAQVKMAPSSSLQRAQQTFYQEPGLVEPEPRALFGAGASAQKKAAPPEEVTLSTLSLSDSTETESSADSRQRTEQSLKRLSKSELLARREEIDRELELMDRRKQIDLQLDLLE